MGGVSSVMPITEEIKKRAGELGGNLAKAMKMKTEFPLETEKILARRDYFRGIIESHEEEWPAEYNYWKEKGWIV